MTRLRRFAGISGGIVAVGLGLPVGSASAQDTPRPPPDGEPAAAIDAGTARELIERLERMERENKKLHERLDTISKRYDDLSKKVGDRDEKEAKDEKEEGGDGPSGDPSGDGGEGRAGGGASASGTTGGGARPAQREAQDVGNRRLGKVPLKPYYNYGREGFTIESADQELQLRIRAELQADAMIYQQRNQDPVHGGFYLPRTRFYFQGYVTRPVEYQLSFQRSYNTFAPLNVYLNFNYDPRLQLRVGRFKVPFLYEWYKLNNWRLIAPERSLFALNFQGNRQIGVMGWGRLFDERMEYAVGVFDGPRNSFQDYNDAKDLMALLNFKPWQDRDGHPLQDLNIGGSVDAGYQNNPLRPAVLRTNVNASTETINGGNPTSGATIPFLAFNNDVRERGMRRLWELHMAYYYKGLSLLAAWESGFDSYSKTPAGSPNVGLPIGGYFVQAAYLLTGETIHDRVVVEPIRRFDLRPGRFGPGAWEVHSRYSELGLGGEVFARGLADPNLWTNRAQLIDVGVNWYLNKWTKIYFDWEHAIFAQPVYFRPGGLQKTSDLFWARFQVYF